MIEPVSYINPLVTGRTDPDSPNPPWDMEELYGYLYHGMMDRPWSRCLIHMPQGWVHTMAGGAWYGMSLETRDVYAEVIGKVLAERPEYRVSIYSGFQFYSAYSIVGRPRPADGQGFIGEPAWADTDDPQTVRGIRNLSVRPWADIGVTGWVFDSGSKDPREIVRWKMKLRGVVSDVGLEAIPWKGSTDKGHIDWWAAIMRGVSYHGLTRYRNGRPYKERVPEAAAGKAFVWLNHDPIPDVAELVGMMSRGWTPVPNRKYDDLVVEALEKM